MVSQLKKLKMNKEFKGEFIYDAGWIFKDPKRVIYRCTSEMPKEFDGMPMDEDTFDCHVRYNLSTLNMKIGFLRYNKETDNLCYQIAVKPISSNGEYFPAAKVVRIMMDKIINE